MLPHVFDLFKQGDRSLARTEGGLGIGLTMVKALTELHGGTVTAASDGPGKGSEFVVRLPTARREPPGPIEPMAMPAKKRTGNRILVVDDNVDLSRALTTLLSRFGYEAQAVNDGHTAIEAARAFDPKSCCSISVYRGSTVLKSREDSDARKAFATRRSSRSPATDRKMAADIRVKRGSITTSSNRSRSKHSWRCWNAAAEENRSRRRDGGSDRKAFEPADETHRRNRKTGAAGDPP